ncbi:MAG: GIY-YIG nuclease family protein [Proteobacteria bacterium]|nr:GIY-YIG nuclease family protein [Pseudomonadota bacterium]
MAGSKGDNWSIYLIEAENGSLYTGITTDPERRFDEHRAQKKGAKFFRSSGFKAVRMQVAGFGRSEALQIEYRLKRLPRDQKIEMIASANKRKLRALLKQDKQRKSRKPQKKKESP